MITDPRTIPETGRGRRVYAVAVGLLATLLIAPWTSEFAAKLAVLGSLTLVCAARPALIVLAGRSGLGRVAGWTPARLGAAASVAVVAVVAAGLLSATPSTASAPVAVGRIPAVTVDRTPGSRRSTIATARRIAGDLVADLDDSIAALRARDRVVAKRGATGDWLAQLWGKIDAAKGRPIDVPVVDAERVRAATRARQGPGAAARRRHAQRDDADGAIRPRGRQLHVPERPPGRRPDVRARPERRPVPRHGANVAAPLAGRPSRRCRAPFTLTDVATSVGLDFRQGAFRFGVTGDEAAMMGGGLCWLDYDGDGWLDLYVVNSYADSDIRAIHGRGGLPRSRLFHNVHGRFVDVTAKTRTGLAVRGSGCVAADLDGNGTTDLVVTTAGYDAARDAYDAVLWNNGDGTFTESAKATGIDQPGWHTGAAVADVERRRQARPPRRGLHRRQPSAPRVAVRLPRQPRRGARPALPQRRAAGRARATSGRSAGAPGSSRTGSTTGSARSSPTSTATGARISTSRTTSTRIGSTSTSRRRTVSASDWSSRGRRSPSTTRTRAWGSRPATSPATDATTCS